MSVLFAVALVLSGLGEKTWKVGGSTVTRIVDNETGVVCYVIPEAHCTGDCAYGPAISCVGLQLRAVKP